MVVGYLVLFDDNSIVYFVRNARLRWHLLYSNVPVTNSVLAFVRKELQALSTIHTLRSRQIQPTASRCKQGPVSD